jgi:hypothetical protein
MITVANLSVILLLLIIGGPIGLFCYIRPLSTQLYVVPFPSLIGNNGDGSLSHPYLSLQQALDHIEREYNRETTAMRTTTINLYPTYHFTDTVHFTQAHSHIRLTTMSAKDTAVYERLATREHTHQRLTTATISGGVPVTGWTQFSGNTYSAVVPSTLFVNQLFVNNQRIVRTRVPMNHSEYLQYAAPLNDSILVRYGFQYVPG